MTELPPRHLEVSQEDYEALAAFRFELRKFLQFSEAAAKALGLTPQQHQALLAIRAARGQSMSVGELARQLFVQPHSASELTDRLVALDLLARACSNDDRRSVRVALTPAAEQRLACMSTVHRGEVVRIRDELIKILGKISGGANPVRAGRKPRKQLATRPMPESGAPAIE